MSQTCNNFCTCVIRESRDHSNELRCLLGEKQFKKCHCIPKANLEEKRYKKFHYNGSFHKSLAHSTVDGSLLNNQNYENMRKAIINNDQILLNSVSLNPGSQMKLANPLASWVTLLIGTPQCALDIVPSPTLSSKASAANMVELYSQAYARDVSFTDYTSDPIIATILDTNHINKPDVLTNLLYKLPGTFTAKTLFRGPFIGETVGPYVSQLLLLNFPTGGLNVQQSYLTLISPATAAPNRVEWGINKSEMIAIQNGLLNTLPPLLPSVTRRKFIFNGRGLAEACHNDAVYQVFYQGAQILSRLGILPNPGWPTYINQTSFITGPTLANLLCALGTVSDLALKNVWYCKWQLCRNLRPEVFSLWIDNILDGTVSNVGNYDINDIVLNNGILTNIFGLYGSLTLPQCYREGSPIHPSYPSGHAILSGACGTLFKIFFDAERPWSSLPGVTSGALASLPGVIQADSTGSNLIGYTESDVSSITIAGEINKLVANVGIARDWAGIHYRTDIIVGSELGERLAIKFMEDSLSATVENNLDGTIPKISFRKLNGELYTLKLTVCQKDCKKKKCH